MTNFLSSYIVGTNAPALIGLKGGTWYFNSKLQIPIMYPRGADISGMNLLLLKYWNGQFDEHIIFKGLVLFVDADHARVVSDLR